MRVAQDIQENLFQPQFIACIYLIEVSRNANPKILPPLLSLCGTDRRETFYHLLKIENLLTYRHLSPFDTQKDPKCH